MPDQITLMYTQDLQGDLALLPRLYTFIRQLQAQTGGRALLLDLGRSCLPQVWPCDVTGGRATLVVLDGMGYHAANVEGMLAVGSREHLKNSISTALVDAQHAWRYHLPPERDEGIIVSVVPTPALRLNIVLTPSHSTHLDGNTLHLQAVAKGQVGSAMVDLSGKPLLMQHEIVPMPDGLRPEPTIAAAVELVEAEARRTTL